MATNPIVLGQTMNSLFRIFANLKNDGYQSDNHKHIYG